MSGTVLALLALLACACGAIGMAVNRRRLAEGRYAEAVRALQDAEDRRTELEHELAVERGRLQALERWRKEFLALLTEQSTSPLEDIPKLGRLEAGTLELASVEFELTEVIDNLKRLGGPIALGKGLQLHVSLAPDVPRALSGDPARLGQILFRLSRHAIHLAAQGTVSVAITSVAQGSSRAASVLLRFEVTHQGKVAESREVGRDERIAQGLAELMGGSLGAEVSAGPARTVWATARVRRAKARLPNEPAERALRGRRILVAGADEAQLKTARESLERAGVEVSSAGTGVEAIAAVHNAAAVKMPFDAVLMALQMPEMDGIAATLELRRDPRSARLPLIALTPNETADDQAWQASGMNDQLSLPLDAAELIATLARWMPSATQAEPEPALATANE